MNIFDQDPKDDENQETPSPHSLNVQSTDHSIAIGGNVTDSLINIGDILLGDVSAGTLPPKPGPLTGRSDDLAFLKARLGIYPTGLDPEGMKPITIVRGWAGVGKTKLAAALAYDPEINAAFPDGILWASLGQTPNLMAVLAAWGRSLGSNHIARASDIREASSLLAGILRNKKMLLLVDDLWQSEHAEAFRIGGRQCSLVVTTRASEIAQNLSTVPEDIYRLDVLSQGSSLELLTNLAPDVASSHPKQCRELIAELGGLPLALQVAGRLLQTEFQLGWGVVELLEALRSGKKLLEAKAPSDRADVELGTTPTVAVLLEKSTELLNEELRSRFALLGVFAPEPASFDLAALEAMWLTDDPKDSARELVARGLLESLPDNGRFQIHVLLALHARSMLTE
jgi:hypothetical protein